MLPSACTTQSSGNPSPIRVNRLRGGVHQEYGDETPRARSDAYGKMLYSRDNDFEIARRLGEVAQARGLPDAQVALAWMLAKPGISAPIIGATKMQHLEDAVAALSVSLSADEMGRLEELYQPHQVLGFS